MVPGGRFELPTRGFSVPCSTPELSGPCGYKYIARGICVKTPDAYKKNMKACPLISAFKAKKN